MTSVGSLSTTQLEVTPERNNTASIRFHQNPSFSSELPNHRSNTSLWVERLSQRMPTEEWQRKYRLGLLLSAQRQRWTVSGQQAVLREVQYINLASWAPTWCHVPWWAQPKGHDRKNWLHVLFPLVLKSPWENFINWLNWWSAINKWYKTWMGKNIRLCLHINDCSGPVLGACWGTEELGWKRGSRAWTRETR